MSGKSFSIVEYYGPHSGSKCGYCKSTNGSSSTGMWAHFLTTTDYQNLIDRGWRRSGLYCYKPTMDTTCCPLYTIKCDAVNFKLTKSHKQILKRMTKFLQDGVKDKPANETHVNGPLEADVGMAELPSAPVTSRVKIATNNVIKGSKGVVKPIVEAKAVSETNQTNSEEPEKVQVVEVPEKSGADPSKPVCKKAKVLRLERRRQKLLAAGRPVDQAAPSKNAERTLEDLLHEPTTGNCAHKLKLKLLLVNSEEFNATKKCEYALYKKYQKIVHDDEPKHISEFVGFLVETPLQAHKSPGGPPSGYGSFHQQYWLDDKLIAVAVIDILPNCVSSVYFFYDPDYRFLSLGTYGSLRELALVRELHQNCPDLLNYYMGFYIHSCPKMRYKGRLAPSYLLCPEAYTWHLLDETLINRLEASKYCRLDPDPQAKDAEAPSADDTDGVLIFYNREWMRYETYKELTDANFETVREYATLVGRKCFTKMLLYRDD